MRDLITPLNASLVSMLTVAIVGPAVFAVFELESAAWRKIVKWLVVSAITVALSFVIGYWAALVPWGAGLLGVAVHYAWCARNKIDPISAAPRRRYYELRGWKWQE